MTVQSKVSDVITGREYLRVSVDRSGRVRSHDEQHEENADDAAGQGIRLGVAYRDVGSASRYARKARDDFDKLIVDLERDRFGGQVLMLWESSRGSRKVSEWVRLIELCEQRGVLIRVTTHRRTYDPANPRDRRSLLEDGVDSEYESAKSSERVRRAVAASAAAGRPHGPVPFGYQRRYDPETRRLVAQEPKPDEAPIVKELVERLAKGHSLRSIEKDFEARGILNDSGKPFSSQHLRSVALNPAYAGLRAHDPGGRGGSYRPSERATLVKGTWPALVSKQRYYAVRRKLTAPERKTTRPGRGKHFLSMIAKCAPCGGPLAVSLHGERPAYVCHRKRCVRVDKAELDAFAEHEMLAYLARSDVHDALTADEGNDEDLAAVRNELAELRTQLDELADAVAKRAISVALAARSEPQILDQISALEQRERELSTPSALRGLIEPGEDVRLRWEAAPMSARREAARLLLSAGMLGELRVIRSPAPGLKVPIEDRVVWWPPDQGN